MTESVGALDLGVAPSENGPSGNGRGRVVRHQSRLPSGRALVGGFLVAAAAVGIFAAYDSASGGPSGSYVVARRDVAVGQRLSADDLELVPLDLPAAQRARAFDDLRVLLGATVVAPVRAHDLVQASAVARSGGDPGNQQLSFSLDASRALGGRLKPGERVDVLATYGSGNDAFTTVVAGGALVIAVDTDDAAFGAQDGSVVLTLAVPRRNEALALAHAAHAGQLTLVRAGEATSEPSANTYKPAPPPSGR